MCTFTDHLYVVVRGLRLVDPLTEECRANPSAMLEQGQANDGERNQQVEAAAGWSPESDRRHQTEEHGEDVQRGACPVGRDQPEDGDKRSDDAAQGGECVDRAGGVAGRLDIL